MIFKSFLQTFFVVKKEQNCYTVEKRKLSFELMFQNMFVPYHMNIEGKLIMGIDLYHGSGEIVTFPEIRKTKYTKDFSWGFYTRVSCWKNSQLRYCGRPHGG